MHSDHAPFSENAKMLGDSRAAHIEVRRDRPRVELASSEHLDDSTPSGIGKNIKSRHKASVSILLRLPQGVHPSS